LPRLKIVLAKARRRKGPSVVMGFFILSSNLV